MLSPGVLLALKGAEQLADALTAPDDRERALDVYERTVRDALGAWMELVAYLYDGRLFALFRAGEDMMRQRSNILTRAVSSHIERHLATMASGTATTMTYSRGLLRVLGRYGMRGVDPAPLAVRRAVADRNTPQESLWRHNGPEMALRWIRRGCWGCCASMALHGGASPSSAVSTGRSGGSAARRQPSPGSSSRWPAPSFAAVLSNQRQVRGPRGWVRSAGMRTACSPSSRARSRRAWSSGDPARARSTSRCYIRDIRRGAGGGRGLVVVTGHFGSWEIAARVLSRLGRPVNLVTAHEPNPSVRAFVHSLRTRHGFQ